MKTLLILSIFAILSVCGCSDSHKHGTGLMDDNALVRDFDALQGKRILFGHQSVGGNIIDGLRDLTRGRTDVRFTIVDLEKTQRPSGPYFGEIRIGKNGDPASKCDAFTRTVDRLVSDSLDIALMKFCYVDFDRGTDVKGVFSNYTATIDSLRRRAPGVTFVHATVPLTVRTPGWKKVLKRVLGRDESSDLLNQKRQEFNELLRSRYGNEPLFDLAAVESTYPDGSREEFTHNGATVYALIGALSDDGSHLNKAGRDAAARELVRVLARAAGGERSL
jgi:hypothetical protein